MELIANMEIKPTVYLMKDSVSNTDQIFKDANSLLKTQNDDVWLYYKDSHQHAPKWLSFLTSSFTVDSKRFYNASAYAVIILAIENRFFAIPLGMGIHLIDLSMIEYNFGLKIAINCIPKNELRQLDLTTPESNSQKTKKQTIKNSTPEDFGVNKQKDILRGVVGKLNKNHPLCGRIEGKDSIRISKKITSINELKQLCRNLLQYYHASDYKKDYPWLDNMAIISDPLLLEQLYEELIAAIKSKNYNHMHISTPEFIDELYQYEGFVFSGNKKRIKNKTVYLFPTIDDLITDLGEDCINALNRDTLSKSYKLHLKDSQDELKFGWPLIRCLVWEIEKNDTKYILSEGTWYKINKQFYEEINEYFNARVKQNTRLPLMPFHKLIESEYNYMACESDIDLHLFDLGHESAQHRTITKDGNEICDIFDARNKCFIHIKPGKSSTTISHLFRQGVFSGRTLKSEPTQLTRFKEYLTECGCAPNFINSPYNPSDYKIAFAVILASNQKTDIPFFSKVSFKDASELTLELMGYQCEFNYILSGENKSLI